MAILRSSAFQGVPFNAGRVQGPILANHLADIARDQALVFELLSNQSADVLGGGTAALTAGHDHTEDGNLLFWPLMYQAFGNRKAPVGEGTENNPLSIELGSSSSVQTLQWFPIFIPAGWAGKTFYLVVDMSTQSDSSDLLMTLHDNTATVIGAAPVDATNPVANNENIILATNLGVDYDVFGAAHGLFYRNGDERDRLWIAPFVPATTGLHSIQLKTNINAVGQDFRRVFSMGVMAQLPTPLGNDAPRKPALRATTQVQIGDPNATGDWHEIDANFGLDDGALDAIITLLANNDAMLQELARAIPASGSAGPGLGITKGHDHDNALTGGALAFGASLSYSVGAWCFGTMSPIADIFGNHSIGPGAKQTGVQAGTLIPWTELRLRLHQHSQTTGVNSDLYAAIITNSDSGPAVGLQVDLSIDGNTLSFPSNPSPGGFRIQLQGRFAYTAAANNQMLIELTDTIGKNDGTKNTLSGLCAFFNPP